MNQYGRAVPLTVAILTMASTLSGCDPVWADDQKVDSLQAQGEQIVRDGGDGLGPPQSTAEGSAADLIRGKKIYLRSCSMCHGPSGSGAIGPSLRKLNTRMTFEQILSQIRTPRGVMPKLYPNQLSDQDVLNVAAFAYAL